jgi:hypothetical protein
MEFDGLRIRCRAAFDAYHARFENLLDQCKAGHQPAPHELSAETIALYEYTKTRRELLEALAKFPF